MLHKRQYSHSKLRPSFTTTSLVSWHSSRFADDRCYGPITSRIIVQKLSQAKSLVFWELLLLWAFKIRHLHCPTLCAVSELPSHATEKSTWFRMTKNDLLNLVPFLAGKLNISACVIHFPIMYIGYSIVLFVF